MSTGVIFILGKGGSPILASGVKSTWPQGSSAPGFSIVDVELRQRRWREKYRAGILSLNFRIS